jgi:hypothetical protein
MRPFLIVAFTFLLLNSNAQSHKGLCNVEVKNVTDLNFFGPTFSFDVTFKNNSNRSISYIYYDVECYNYDGEKLGWFENKQGAKKITLLPGQLYEEHRSLNKSGTSKVAIKIRKIVYESGSTCE